MNNKPKHCVIECNGWNSKMSRTSSVPISALLNCVDKVDFDPLLH